ncbi:formate dehydrogenase accessory sulfurtransferase FdhD [Tuberibacillus calidus]|jgi:FdhD protein|uniref:formate dehydrogenase accessory sulfurtransferase FdhD n=1 Tax=Tuberibacillus calidus TaxID=340097 RepID=UPI00040052CD
MESMEKAMSVRRTLDKVTENGWIHTEDMVASEWPLTINVNGLEAATLVCSPSHVRELVIGFLASEGIIRSAEDCLDITFNESQGYAYVTVKGDVKAALERGQRRFIGSCCGKSRQFYLQNDAYTARTVYTNTCITPAQCFALMEELKNRSDVFNETGGVHNAAYCHPDRLICIRSDIGRHNALDKLYGFLLENRLQTKLGVLAFSGRISSEIILKAAKMGIGIVLSKAAPTDLALELADELNITAIGFIRNGSMNIYTHKERVAGPYANGL